MNKLKILSALRTFCYRASRYCWTMNVVIIRFDDEYGRKHNSIMMVMYVLSKSLLNLIDFETGSVTIGLKCRDQVSELNSSIKITRPVVSGCSISIN